MNGRDIVKRLAAYREGGALPDGDTIHFHIADDADALVVAFLRMGGESRPWAIAYGHPHDEPRILSVPDARRFDDVAGMAAEFAPDLLAHFHTYPYIDVAPAEWEDLQPLRQVWLPNSSHLDMLHNLAYTYIRTKARPELNRHLNALGRLCGWLFREAQRAGQQHIRVATADLRRSYTFPAQDTRQGHLGFLLAWLDGQADAASRAYQAEREAISTSLDPAVEREAAQPLVEAVQAGSESAATDLHDLLGDAVSRRWHLAVAAIDQLRGDGRRVNAGVDVLVAEALREQWYQHTRQEYRIDDDVDGPAFVASPETDRYPAAAGSRYQVYLLSADLEEAELIQDDAELRAEALSAGDAFSGTVVDVYDMGEGRKSDPIWVIDSASQGPLRLREGGWVSLVGTPKRTAIIQDVDELADGGRRFTVLINGWKTKPDKANDSAHVGRVVTFVPNPTHGINRRKSQRIWNADIPGGWLTHARAGGPRAAVPDDVAEDVNAIVRKVTGGTQ